MRASATIARRPCVSAVAPIGEHRQIGVYSPLVLDSHLATSGIGDLIHDSTLKDHVERVGYMARK